MSIINFELLLDVFLELKKEPHYKELNDENLLIVASILMMDQRLGFVEESLGDIE